MADPQVIRAQAPAVQAAPHSAHAAARERLAMVLFGATGDLSGRKILPALFALWKGKFLPDRIVILGVAIEKLSDDQFRDHARKAITEHGRIKPASDDEWKEFAKLLSYQPVDFSNSASFDDLGKRIVGLEAQNQLPG